MSNDKLQEIKQLAVNAVANGTGHVDLTTYAVTWLISQLEQAQAEINRLDSKLFDMKHAAVTEHSMRTKLQSENEQLKADKQKLVEVVNFYGSPLNYVRPKPFYLPFVHADRGERARQVLSEVKGNVGSSD